MYFRYLVFFCLLSLAAMAQPVAQNQAQPDKAIQGIKIFSSHFDPSTQTATLDFMNDSASDITAWIYCMNVENKPDDNVGHGGCRIVDTIPTVIERQVLEQTTLKPINGDFPDYHLLHPGEHRVLSVDFSSVPIVNAEIVIHAIVYANGNTETSSKDDLGMVQHIAKQRQNALSQHAELAAMGENILSDKSDQHPTATMIESLQRKHPEWTQVLHHFKSPGWRKENDTEFIPKDERGYLQNFVTEHKLQANELAKHQIPGVSQ